MMTPWIAFANGLSSVMLIGLGTRWLAGRLTTPAIGDVAAVALVAGYLAARFTAPLPDGWGGTALTGRIAGIALGYALLCWACLRDHPSLRARLARR